MPKIIADQKQQEALEEIERDIIMIKQIDELLSSDSIVLSNTTSKKGSKITVAGDVAAKIKNTMTSYRKKIAKEILSKAKKNRLMLDDEETALLDNNSADASNETSFLSPLENPEA